MSVWTDVERNKDRILSLEKRLASLESPAPEPGGAGEDECEVCGCDRPCRKTHEENAALRAKLEAAERERDESNAIRSAIESPKELIDARRLARDGEKKALARAESAERERAMYQKLAAGNLDAVKAQATRAEKAEKERDAHDDACNAEMTAHQATMRERDALAKALRRYGDHEYDCEDEGNPGEPCTCGFRAALPAEPCSTCGGTGWIEAPRHVNACPDCDGERGS